jgi:hypothetical protein
MTKIRLYWNHICVLHKQELVFLDQIRQQLLTENIDLEISCFGLGYPEHMSDYMRKDDAELPDMIVSADLEVFEDSRIFNRYADSLHPVTEWFPTKDTEHVPKLCRHPGMLPYMAIPLVFYANQAEHSAADCRTLAQAAGQEYRLAFGGINNSAVKTVVKTVLEQHGVNGAAGLLDYHQICDMPIQAFHQVRTNQADIALVPSIYALRADGETTGVFCPSDGVVAIPSYIAARDTIPEAVAKRVITLLMAPEVCNFYVQNGNLISCLAGTPENQWLTDQQTNLQVPSWDFLKELDPVWFYEFYHSYLPTSVIY